jgi:gluconokinase
MNDYDYPLVWIVIGLSGSGKTTIGRLLSQHLECDFLEGDRRHSKSNITKMIAQQPLQDEDRRQWLADIQHEIKEAIDRNREVVITCSALKAKYRQQLSLGSKVQLIWIDVPIAILKQRLEKRPDHFMNAEMLSSQIATFENISPSESIITIDGSKYINDVVSELQAKIIKRFPGMEKLWWERY